jgi:hypothetical protein
MALRIELPEDLIRDLELEASRRHVPLAEIIRDALQIWRASRKAPIDLSLIHILTLPTIA